MAVRHTGPTVARPEHSAGWAKVQAPSCREGSVTLLMPVPRAAVPPSGRYRSGGSPVPPDGRDTRTPPGPAKIPRRLRHTPAPSLAVPQPTPDGRRAHHSPPVLCRGNVLVPCARHDAPAIPGASCTALGAELSVRLAALL